MEYSNYLKGKVRDQGGVQLNVAQFTALFNLAVLEGKISALGKANATAVKIGASPRMNDVDIADAKRMIENITGGLNPSEFMRSLFESE